MSDATEINRAHWDALAAVHGETGYYDGAALVAGADSVREHENAAVEAAVGSVAGLDVLHVQCHIGFDAISLARRGARVTGVDFSAASLAKAADYARRAGVDVTWAEADSTAIPAALHGRFDLAYATIGVLGWIGDVGAWMRSVSATLRPGGRLVLVELHPLLLMVGSLDPLVLDFPYADDGPRRFDMGGSYADRDAVVAATETVEHAHSLGEVVSAAIAAGLRIDALEEHLDADHDPRGDLLPRDEDGRHRLRIGGELLPMLYTLRATKID